MAKRRGMRVVLDTNTLLVNIGRKSKYRPIFDALLDGKIRLLISNDVVGEYIEKLEEKTSVIVAENIATLLTKSSVTIIRTADFLKEIEKL